MEGREIGTGNDSNIRGDGHREQDTRIGGLRLESGTETGKNRVFWRIICCLPFSRAFIELRKSVYGDCKEGDKWIGMLDKGRMRRRREAARQDINKY